jgi:apolipoprotein D and lipocalin family protein
MELKKYGWVGMAVLAAATMIALNSCGSTIPEGATAVKPFDVRRYTGKWYEIARLDFKQERGLNNTSAEYSLNADGTIGVLNRGFDFEKNKWQEAKGKAKFVGDQAEGRLKVSFFGPFYSGYNVIGLDSNYRYALVAGESLKYLWILSREKSIPENVKQEFLANAKSIGYNTDNLLWVEHNSQ